MFQPLPQDERDAKIHIFLLYTPELIRLASDQVILAQQELLQPAWEGLCDSILCSTQEVGNPRYVDEYFNDESKKKTYLKAVT